MTAVLTGGGGATLTITSAAWLKLATPRPSASANAFKHLSLRSGARSGTAAHALKSAGPHCLARAQTYAEECALQRLTIALS
jgi:hypothetical protein